ncbi:MAG: type VI secretion system membrane subunit TssM [Rubrivivax sp.]
MKRFLRALLSPAVLGTLGLLALSALIWWLGPLLGLGDFRPLAPVLWRALLIGLLWLLWIGRLVWVGWRRRRTNVALLQGMSAGPSASDQEAQQLAQRFSDALARLRTSRGRSWFGGGTYLYELPWYVFVGAPGSGKTTALMNAGLQFLLTDGAGGRAAVRGVGGTRNCEWWFTQDAVLIDTAGRYATQESDRDVDANAWDRFLALLKRTRPRQPINGVLLTINVQDLLQQGAAEREEHAGKLRARLQELQTKLGLRAPVYVLVTKADLVGGFNESFEPMGKEERDQVWGFTFDPATPSDDPLRDYAPLSAQLGERLALQLTDRLERERDPLRRAAIFAFPQEFSALQTLLGDFLRRVFAGGGTLEKSPRVRGVYFTSGTQEGSPIDRVMGALGRSFGIDPRRAAAAGAQGKSYFLHRLLRDVVFAERGLGTVNPRAERRRRVWRAATVSVVALAGTALLVGWIVSRSRNVAYAEQVAARVPALRQSVAALPAPSGVDVAPVVPVLTAVEQSAHSEAFSLEDPPPLNGLGLYQGEKLDAAAQLAYHRLLDKALAPRVVHRIEERLRAVNKDQLESAYESLKHYLMLYDPEHFDAEALKPWIVEDWRTNVGRNMAPEQLSALEGHLDALLALGPPRELPPKDEALVASVREMLVPFTLEHLAYNRIKRGYVAGRLPDFSVASAGGPNAAQVFERASGAPLTQGVSGFSTREGYRQVLQPEVDRVVLQLAREQPWVRGNAGGAAALKDAAPGGALADRVRRLYFEDYIKTWDAYLTDVRLVRLAGLERSIAVARIVSAPDSPLAAYLRGVAEQTTLVPPVGKPSALDKLASQAEKKVTAVTGGAAAGPPLERMVDDHFASVRRQVEGTPPPIDETLKLFNEVYVQLSAVDAAQKSKSPAPPAGAAERVKAAAGQLPDPVRSMLTELADAGASQSRDAAVSGLNAELKPVSEFCGRAIAGRYPFASGAGADVPPEDFGRFFGVGGLMDEFFQRKLADLVDVSGARWVYKPLADGTRRPSPPALAEFQRAARIREVFFRSGGSVPSVKLELRALEIDPGLKELVLDIDGQAHRLAVGQPSVILTAPSARNASQLKLSAAGGAPGALQFEGPWALFRLFDRFEVQPTAQPEKIVVVLSIDGRRAKLEVVAGSVFNPFRLREVQQFRCPASL